MIDYYIHPTIQEKFRKAYKDLDELKKKDKDKWVEEKLKLDSWMEDCNIAYELCFNNTVINKLRAQPDPIGRQRILIDARRALS